MKRNAIALIIAAVVLTGGFFLYKINSPAPADKVETSGEKSRNVYPAATDPSKPAAAQAAPSPAETKMETHIERLRKEGYVDNPKDPYSMIKKFKKADGKEVTYIMPKDPGQNDYFEPTDRTAKTAEETLESKKNENPLEELSELRPLDVDEQNSIMLLGKFRDEANDIELRFSKIYDEADRPTDQDMICFVAPKLGINMKRNFNGLVRVDGTGYGLLKLNDRLFIRVAWSYENKRALHGQVLQMESGQAQNIQGFTAVENSKGLKHCD